MFICNKCKKIISKWMRECPVCSAEHSLEKQQQLLSDGYMQKKDTLSQEHLPTGFELFDRIFGGGFLLGYLYFIHAMRGAGKTTFLLQVCAYLVNLGKTVIFFSFDESKQGIIEKTIKYNLSHSPIFICENNQGVIERALLDHNPDFVVVDSLQSLAKYNNDAVISTLYRLRKEAQKKDFALVVIGEERKDGSDYLGSTSIGHIVDVLIKMVMGLDEEVIISTPKKNRDTDDKTSRCFFRRTPDGLVEIPENQTGYRLRHKENAIVGLAAFIPREGVEFVADEITAVAVNTNNDRASLTIAGMNSSKSKNLLAVLENHSLINNASFAIRANHSEKLRDDAELACLVAIKSKALDKPIPVDTAFIGGVDNRGYLLPVEGMERRVRRAEALGYQRIIGPRANGTQVACWEEAETIEEVLQSLGFVK